MANSQNRPMKLRVVEPLTRRMGKKPASGSAYSVIKESYSNGVDIVDMTSQALTLKTQRTNLLISTLRPRAITLVPASFLD